MTPQILVSILGAFGIGGLVGAFFKSRFELWKEIRTEERELKLTRYKCIMILLLAKLDPQNGICHLTSRRSDIKTEQDLDKEIETEFLNGLLYAGDDVIIAISNFIRKPNRQTCAHVGFLMRKDLWGKKTKIKERNFDSLFLTSELP